MTRRTRCSCCMDIRSDRKDFRRGAVDIEDFDDDFRYVRLKKKDKNFCPKEKEQIPCQKFQKVITWTFYSKPDNILRERGHWACIKCGRNTHHYFSW